MEDTAAEEVVGPGTVVGEIRINAKPDGSIDVGTNMKSIVQVIGVIELAKKILMDDNERKARQAAAMRPPAIVAAGSDALKSLDRARRPS